MKPAAQERTPRRLHSSQDATWFASAEEVAPDSATRLLALRRCILLALGLSLPTLTACTSSGGIQGGGSGDGSGGQGGDGGKVGKKGPSKTCVDPKPILTEAKVDTGYVRCADEMILRITPVDADPSFTGKQCDGNVENGDCKKTEDCTAKPHGACMPYTSMPGGIDGCSCIYPCANDAECGSGRVCIPPEAASGGHRGVSRCVDAQCKTGADCRSGDCVLSQYFTGCGTEEILACRENGASCKSDADCSDGKDCAINRENGKWECQGMTCVVGRPFLVEEQVRVAGTCVRQDWCATTEDQSGGPALADAIGEAAMNAVGDLSLNNLAAAYWLEIALMEHASVASFSRFSLALLSLGAPPELLSMSARAAADEIEHAKLAFGLASRFSGKAIGPAALALDGIQLDQPLHEIVLDLIMEGCVGETCAVAQAERALGSCQDEAVRGVLLRIVEDESRHAELAWRSLEWLLVTYGAPVSAAMDLALVQLEAQAGELGSAAERIVGHDSSRARELEAIGVLSLDAMAQARRFALRTVVLPCARALRGRIVQSTVQLS